MDVSGWSIFSAFLKDVAVVFTQTIRKKNLRLTNSSQFRKNARKRLLKGKKVFTRENN